MRPATLATVTFCLTCCGGTSATSLFADGAGTSQRPAEGEAAPATSLLGEPTPRDAGPPELERWLLTIENQSNNEVHRLVRISLDPASLGEKLEICADVKLPPSVPKANIISSLTFNQERLYASGKGADEGDTLFLVDPCQCAASVVGQYGYTFVAGITSTGDQHMFGISGGQDVFLQVNPATAVSTQLSELGSDWNTVGLSWSGAERNTLWAIDGAQDRAIEYTVTGSMVGAPITLDYPFGSVGLEYHPGLRKLYACSDPGDLLEVDTTTGHVSIGPSLNQPGCNNLAAPYGRVACIPNIR
jgi:hypothetical protein